MSKVLCKICPHNCMIEDGRRGYCGARANRNGRVIADNYGKVTSIALDPIEKKPLKRFHAGAKVLSVGSYGCNFRCSFCQNHGISMERDPIYYLDISPEQLIEKAIKMVPQGNIGLAYTYNEPLIGYEFVMDCSKLAAKKNLNNVVITNGYINEEPLKDLLPYIHAFNIDLKSFSPAFYKKIGGDLEVVKRSIEIASEKTHVEVTTLIITDENDNEEEMVSLSKWLASVNPAIPLHITRFFPSYRMTDRDATSVDTIHKLACIAKESLKFVYKGNI